MELHPEVKKFLSNAGKKGGRSKSEAKMRALEINQKLGGAPLGNKHACKKPVK